MRVKRGFEQEYTDYFEMNSKDDYSKAIVDWGEAFGQLLDAGRSDFPEIFRESHKSIAYGCSGFQRDCMITAITHFHPRGQELQHDKH